MVGMPASASIIATIYLDVPDPGNSADPANEGSGLASAQFAPTAINFQTDNSDGTTIGDWLGNPTFSNEMNGFDPSHLTDNSELVITGQTYLNAGSNSFVVAHDDGVVLTFADPSIGTVVDQPGPTAEVFTPFDVTAATAGFYDFTLYYTECCGGPADLVWQINGGPVGNNVPEPLTLSLFGAGLAGLGAMRRRNKAAKVA